MESGPAGRCIALNRVTVQLMKVAVGVSTDARSASTRDNKPEDVGGIVTKPRSVTNYHRRIRGQTQDL